MKTVTIQLTLEQLNVVMQGLYELPQKTARAVTDDIVAQVNAQASAAPAHPSDQIAG